MEGGCTCGEVRYRLTSEPLFVHCCHCLSCQRQTGSAFVINLLIERDRVELLSGEPTRGRRSARQRRDAAHLPLPELPDRALQRVHLPGGVVRARGTLDEPRSVTPDVHIFTRSKVDWVQIPESAAAFDVFYKLDELWPSESLERIQALKDG